MASFLAIGAAFDWYVSLADGIRTNFDILKQKSIQRFGKVDNIQTLSDLFQMWQRAIQSVRDFVHKVQTKANTADIVTCSPRQYLRGN